MLVAINALSIAQRELALADELLQEEVERLADLLGGSRASPHSKGRCLRTHATDLNRRLAHQIREGAPPPGTLHHLVLAATARLEVNSPNYLLRYERPDI
jgi:hypothetical protein